MLPTSFADALTIPIFIVYFLNIIIFLSGIAYGFTKFNILPRWRKKQYSQLMASDWPGITILKPLTGVDASLEDNLESYFNLDYPRFELHFCIEDRQDPSIPVVRQLLAKYPQIDARLFVGGTPVGVNPKINNMTAAFLASHYEWFMIADTGIWMRPDTLKDMMYCAIREKRVGIVHQCPFYRLPTQLSVLHNHRDAFLKQMVFFGTWHAKMYLALNFGGFNCATGMSSLYRRDVILETHPTNALLPYANYLAEDFFIAEDYYRKGWKIRMAHQPAWQNPGIVTREMFSARMQRWFQLRLTMMPLAALVEPMFECFPSMVLMSWALYHHGMDLSNILLWGILHVMLWICCDAFIMHFIALAYPQENVHRHAASTTWSSFLRLWLEQELTSIPNRVHALRQPTVNWRGRMFQLKWGGRAVEVTPTTVDGDASCCSGDIKNFVHSRSQCNHLLSDMNFVQGDVLHSSPTKNGSSDGVAR